jgi:hypothetical protein
MNENENLVTEVTENVEPTTTEETVEQVAEPEKVYSEEEFKAKLTEAVGKRVARTEAKIRKEYDRKYGELERVLEAGTGVSGVENQVSKFKEHYSKRGVQFEEKPKYTDRDIEVLARVDADGVIELGLDEVVDEINRYMDIGMENLSPREKATLKMLAEHQDSTEKKKKLARLGVTEDVSESADFKEFASKFSSKTPIEDIVDIYNKTKPKKEIKPMGSIKSNTLTDSGVKEYYSPDEAKRFTQKEIDENPALVAAIERSMAKWNK